MEEGISERIINSVDAVIKKDKQLDEFGIIHSISEVNKSPVIHIDHKLGLESWCVKYVYKYAYTSVMHYCNVGRYEHSDSIIRWTQFCLLIMPEVKSFWNIRKKMILKGLLKIDSDFLLSKLVLTMKPKCIEAFQHRRWLFNTVSSNRELRLKINNIDLNSTEVPANLKEFLWSELNICTLTANQKPNNYHSWNHRLWILEKLSLLGNSAELFKSEYDFTKKWIGVHISEHSGMHYRSKVLDSIAKEFERGGLNLDNIDTYLKSLKELYLKELKINEDWLEAYPEHESLFCYRRVIMQKIQYLFGNHNQRASSPPPAYKRSCIETIDSEWVSVIEKESERFKEGKCLSEHYTQLSQQYLNWINNNFSY